MPLTTPWIAARGGTPRVMRNVPSVRARSWAAWLMGFALVWMPAVHAAAQSPRLELARQSPGSPITSLDMDPAPAAASDAGGQHAGTGAIAGGKSAARGIEMTAPGSTPGSWQPAVNAIGFGMAVSLATLCLWMASFAFTQRRLSNRLEASLAGLEAAGAFSMGAAEISRDAALSMARLAGAGRDAEALLRGWMEQSIAAQERTTTLTTQCTRLTGALPDLLVEAASASHARAQAAMVSATERLEGRLAEITGAAAAVWNGAQSFAAASSQAARAAEAGAPADRLAPSLAEAVALFAGLPGLVSDSVAAVQTQGEAALRHAAQRLENAAAAQQGNAAMQDADLTRMDESAGRIEAALAEMGLQIEAARASQEVAFGLAPTFHLAMSGIEQRSLAIADMLNARLQDGALCVEAAAAEIRCASKTAQTASSAQVATLDGAVGRTGGMAKLLPEITGALAGGAAAVKHEAQQGMAMLAALEARLLATAACMSEIPASLTAHIDRLGGSVEAQRAAAGLLADQAAAMAGTAALLDGQSQALSTATLAQSHTVSLILSRLATADAPAPLPAELAAQFGRLEDGLALLHGARLNDADAMISATRAAADRLTEAAAAAADAAFRLEAAANGVQAKAAPDPADIRDALARVAAGFSALREAKAAQDGAAARVAQAALAVARSIGAVPAPTLRQLNEIAQQTASLFGATSTTISPEPDTGGQTGDGSSIVAEVPATVEAINTLIQRLPPAISLSSNGARNAA